MTTGVRTAIVDDHELLAASLAMALRGLGHETMRPQSPTLEGVRHQVLDFEPDVTLLDLDLGGLRDGAALIPDLAGAGSRVIVVSGTTEEWRLGQSLELGAVGALSKSAPFETLLGAVLAAAENRPPMAASERVRLVDAWRAYRGAEQRRLEPFGRLTRREETVLAALMDGCHVERIAEQAVVSPATVRSQVKSILSKLGVKSQLEAVALAHRASWAPRSPASRPRAAT